MRWILCVVLLALLCGFIETRCPNSCSGHGLCGVGNTCTCFEGWNGGAADCSFRNCPNGTAWADKAYATDKAHQSAECSNAGICDRRTGTCKCFDGFTGAACQRNACPSDCSGHGICATINDVSFYSGVDYDSSVDGSGDGKGFQYTNWDKESIQLCECDGGFFGADCSLVMCPKGDDPLTINQEYRQVRLHVRSGVSGDLRGSLGLRFQGQTTFFPLEYQSGVVSCNTLFSFLGKFGHVGCSQNTLTTQYFTYDLAFYSWPVYPKDNNLYSHDGNPSRLEFFCDASNLSPDISCEFEDISATNIREYAYCSNRGTCDFKTGVCKCIDGYGGPACSNATELYPAGASALPGLIVNVNAFNFTSSAIQIHTSKSPAADFNFIEATANNEKLFFVRGDGLVGIHKMLTMSGGQTIMGGGIAIQSGGCTIYDDGLTVFNSDNSVPVVKISSKFAGVFNDEKYTAVEVSTYATNINNHYFLVGKNRDKTRLQLRADGAILSQGGIMVTGGATLYNVGLNVNGGISINNYGLKIKSGGIQISGGVTINTNGLRVISGGIQVLGGGMTVHSVGVKVVSGISVMSGGVSVTNGVSVNTNGLRITGGLTVFSGGMSITSGLTVHNGGVVVNTGGVTVVRGGVVVSTAGITVTDGGVRISNQGLIVNNGGVSIYSGLQALYGVTVNGGLTVQTRSTFHNGANILAGGLYISAPVSVQNGGLGVTGGLTVYHGKVLALEGLDVFNGLTVYGYTEFDRTPHVFSDRKLKTNIEQIDGALSKVNALKGVYFNWIENEPSGMTFDKKRHVGVIAQEVQQVLPEVVKRKDDSNYLTVDYSSMVALLIEAIHEMDESVNQLKDDCDRANASNLTNDCIALAKLDEEIASLNQEMRTLNTNVEHVRQKNDLLEGDIKAMFGEVEELKRAMQAARK